MRVLVVPQSLQRSLHNHIHLVPIEPEKPAYLYYQPPKTYGIFVSKLGSCSGSKYKLLGLGVFQRFFDFRFSND